MHIIEAETGRLRRPAAFSWSGLSLIIILAALIGAPWWIGLYTIMEWAITR